MFNFSLPSLSFDFVKNYLLEIPKYCWDFVTAKVSLGYSAELEVLRDRYYLNATFLDRMAKTYGELNFFLKLLLLGSAVSMSILFVFNPLFFIFGISLVLMINLLSVQFDAMEKRFKLMLEDIVILEKKLDNKMQENAQLKESLDLSIEKNELLVAELEKNNEEIKAIKLEMIEKLKRISNACEVIESSAQKVSESAVNYVEKTQHMIDSFSTAPEHVTDGIESPKHYVESSMASLSESPENLRESSQVNDYILAFMKKYGIEFNYSTSSQTSERAHSNSFFQRKDLSEGGDNVTGYGIV